MTTLVTKVLMGPWNACQKQFIKWEWVKRSIHCVTCQRTKAAALQPAPHQPEVASRSRKLVEVDVLKVSALHQGNQYMLKMQDYFSKWLFADQKANKMVWALRDQVITLIGLPVDYILTMAGTFRARCSVNSARPLVQPSPEQHCMTLWGIGLLNG